MSALIAGCSEGQPENMPAPKPGAFASFKNDCPDLRGHYAVRQPDGSKYLPPGQALRGLLGETPSYHSVWSVDKIDKESIVITTHASESDVKKAFLEWRDKEDYQYAIWSQSLKPRSMPTGVLLYRDTTRTTTPVWIQTFRRQKIIPGNQYTCLDGWVVFHGEEEPDVNSLQSGKVRMTRAEDGGIIAFSKYQYEQSLSLWCGDGCKPDIPLPNAHKEYWWHARPAAFINDFSVDWGAWIKDDKRPLKVREMYKDGTFMPYATQEDIDKKLNDEKAQDKKELNGVLTEEHETIQRAGNTNLPDKAEPCQQEKDVKPIAKAWSHSFDLACEKEKCTLSGTSASNANVSQMLRAMDQAGFAGVELESVQASDNGILFRVMFSNGCLKH